MPLCGTSSDLCLAGSYLCFQACCFCRRQEVLSRRRCGGRERLASASSHQRAQSLCPLRIRTVVILAPNSTPSLALSLQSFPFMASRTVLSLRPVNGVSAAGLSTSEFSVPNGFLSSLKRKQGMTRYSRDPSRVSRYFCNRLD
jgi:hypothetical protein